MKIRHIVVGSTNPIKVAAVVQAIGNRLPKTTISGTDVKSGVSEQPMTDAETKRGAKNRAKLALSQSQADIAISFEGGVFQTGVDLWNTIWCCALDKKGKIEFANGGRIKLPEAIVRHILKGQEMGPVMDKLTKRKNIKHQEGMLGIITNNWVTRQSVYANLAQLALGRLLTIDWQ